MALTMATLGRAADIPRPAPDFAINMVDGQQIHLSQYKGKAVVVAFILTTCPHCQKTVGYLTAIQNEYGPKLQVVASAIDDMGKMNVPDFIKNFQPSFPVGYRALEDTQVFLEMPTIYRMLVPQLVFIDKQGVIRAQHGGEDQFLVGDQAQHIRDEIDAMLKEPVSAHKKGNTSAAKKTP